MQLRIARAIEIIRSEGGVVFLVKLARHGKAFVARMRNGESAEHRNQRIAADELRARVTKMRARPRHVTVTTTTYCNLKCVMCEHAAVDIADSATREHFRVDRQHLDQRLIERLRPLIATAESFQLHGLGEPLMSPAFWSLLEEISTRHPGNPIVNINTNALLLNEKTIDRIVRSKLNEINVSLDAATPETYGRIRGGDLNKVLKNVEALMCARDAAGRDDMKVMLNMTLMRANIEELPDFVRLAKWLGVDEIAFWRLNDGDNYARPEWVIDKGDWRFVYQNESPKYYPNLFNQNVREAFRISEEIGMPIHADINKSHLIEGEGEREDAEYEFAEPSFASSVVDADGRLAVLQSAGTACATHVAGTAIAELPSLPEARTYQLDVASDAPAPKKNATISACEAPWRWLLVNERGDCQPCCHAQKTVGNLRDASVEQVWNGQTMQEIRASIARGEVHPVCQGASCRYVMGNDA